MKILVVTIYNDGERFQVHATEDGANVRDVTPHYEVREMPARDERGLLDGWYVGRRVEERSPVGVEL